MNSILLWAVQSQDQCRFISTELSPDRHKGWLHHPWQKSGGCSTIIEEREVSCSGQHPTRTSLSRWRGSNHCSHDNLQQALAYTMANPVDPVPGSSHFSKKATCSNARTYRTISLISHPRKVMLKIILNEWKPRAEKIVAEEQATWATVAWQTVSAKSWHCWNTVTTCQRELPAINWRHTCKKGRDNSK